MRIGISRIILCPYWTKKYLKYEYRLYMGRKIHRMVEDILKRKGYSTEVEITERIGKHTLVGVIDAVDYDRISIIEIKPIRSIAHNRYWDLQLGMYVEIFRSTTGLNWKGYFMLYKYRHRDNTVYTKMHRPMILYTSVIRANRREIEKMIDEWDTSIRIAGTVCNKCPLRGRCSPHYTWIYNGGFWKLVKGKPLLRH